MKKIFTLILALTFTQLNAQVDITLLTFESYSFADKIVTGEGYNAEIGDGFQYGAGFEFLFKERMAIEIIYQHLDTDGYVDYPSSILTNQRDHGAVGLDYILLGGTRYQPLTEKLSGFSTFNAGWGFLNTKDNSKDESHDTFCWGLRLGLKLQANEKISFRLHGQMLSAVQALGGGIYFGTGGAGAGLSGYSTFWQFNLGGSINFLLNGKKKESAAPVVPVTEP